MDVGAVEGAGVDGGIEEEEEAERELRRVSRQYIVARIEPWCLWSTHQCASKVDACGAGCGAVKPCGLGEAEEAIVAIHIEANARL